MDTCNKIPPPNMSDTRNAKDCHPQIKKKIKNVT